MGTKNPREFMQTVLPPGFRFHPTDEELIMQYLKNKINSSLKFCTSLIAEIDLYKFNPWELPERALFGDDEWFFFTPRDRKYPNSVRPNRATSSGYWKATGTDKTILSSNGSQCIGVKKSLVFYHGRPRKGSKTNWMMYEYRVLDQNNHSSRLKGSTRLDDWVLCRIRHRNDATNKFFHSNPISISSYCNHHKVEQNDVIKKASDQSCSVEIEVLGDEKCVSLDLEQESSQQYFGTVITIDQVIMQQYVETMEEMFLLNNAPFKLNSNDSENSDIFD